MVHRSKYPSCLAITVLLIACGLARSDRERLKELVSICTGHDLLDTIKRACSIYRRKRNLSVIEPAHPLKVRLEDITKICCATPCRMSLFFLLCS